MLKLVDENLEGFISRCKGKYLFVFGAGRRSQYILREYNILDSVYAFVDNNEKLWNTDFITENHAYPIISVQDFVKNCKEIGVDNIVLLISSLSFSLQIIEQLDTYTELDELDCYVSLIIEDHYTPQNFDFTVGKQRIPAKIHYCWFGKSKIPAHLQKYIDGWKKECPDFEIIRWDENNYDVAKHPYMYEAYKSKKWGFVPDYARLDIIYNEGGVYLDTDVELLKSPRPLLNDDVFMGFMGRVVNHGIGFGAVKGHSLIKKLRDYYDGFSFIKPDGTMNLNACIYYTHPVLLEEGFALNNTYQKKNGVVLYPSEVLCPMGYTQIQKNYTANTISSHNSQLSWGTAEEREGLYTSYEKLYKRIGNM